MKLVVPLMMPATHSMRLAVRPSRSALMMGMLTATAPSYATVTPCWRAAAKISLPCVASSALLAVTTCLPARMAASTHSRAGLVPPATSTTTSTSGCVATQHRVVGQRRVSAHHAHRTGQAAGAHHHQLDAPPPRAPQSRPGCAPARGTCPSPRCQCQSCPRAVGGVPTRWRGWTGAQDSRQDRGTSASPNIKRTNKQKNPAARAGFRAFVLWGKRERSPGGCRNGHLRCAQVAAVVMVIIIRAPIARVNAGSIMPMRTRKAAAGAMTVDGVNDMRRPV